MRPVTGPRARAWPHEQLHGSPGALPPMQRSGDLCPPQASELGPGHRSIMTATGPRARVCPDPSMSLGPPLCSAGLVCAWPPSCRPASVLQQAGERSQAPRRPVQSLAERWKRHVMGCGDGGMARCLATDQGPRLAISPCFHRPR